jgi:hypothetical protein
LKQHINRFLKMVLTLSNNKIQTLIHLPIWCSKESFLMIVVVSHRNEFIKNDVFLFQATKRKETRGT